MGKEDIENDNINNKKKFLKYSFNIVIFIALIYLTFTILLKNENIDEMYSVIISSNVSFVLLGFLCMVIYYLCEAINLRRTLHELDENISIGRALKYVLIGIFFNSITPAASGGQPMLMFFMHKDNIKISKSTVALLLNLFSMQIVTITMEIISVIFFHEYMDSGIFALFVIGVILNVSALSLIVIGMYSEKLSTALVNLASKILRFFKMKNYEKIKENMEHSLDTYHESAKCIRSNKKILFRQLIVAYIQHIFYYSVPFCVLHAFRLPRKSYILTVALQSIVFGTVSGIPSPGAVGVSEGAFQSIFKSIFTSEYINSAMVLHRIISFYLPVCICAVLVLVSIFSLKKKEKLN